MMVKKNPSKYHTHGRLLHSLASSAGGAEEGSSYRKPHKFSIQNGLAFFKQYKFVPSTFCYKRRRSPVVLVSALTGRTSIVPTRAGGICEASWTASFRSAASIK